MTETNKNDTYDVLQRLAMRRFGSDGTGDKTMENGNVTGIERKLAAQHGEPGTRSCVDREVDLG